MSKRSRVGVPCHDRYQRWFELFSRNNDSSSLRHFRNYKLPIVFTYHLLQSRKVQLTVSQKIQRRDLSCLTRRVLPKEKTMSTVWFPCWRLLRGISLTLSDVTVYECVVAPAPLRLVMRSLRTAQTQEIGATRPTSPSVPFTRVQSPSSTFLFRCTFGLVGETTLNTVKNVP